MNAENKDTKYLQFPLLLLRDFFNDRFGTMNKILDAGIYGFGQKNQCSRNEAANRILYDHYRHQDKLTSLLITRLKKYNDDGTLTFDKDYNGFVCTNGFRPETETTELFTIFNNDPEFEKEAIEYANICRAMYILDVPGNTGTILNKGRKILSTVPDHEPWPMVNKDLVFEFRNNTKSEFDTAQLAAYMAIRSIIGKRSYCKTNKQLILARMFGYSTYKRLFEANHSPVIKSVIEKYSNRYWMDKVLKALELNWNIIIDGKGMRGLYVGTKKKIDMESLIRAKETRKHKNKIEALKQRKEQARAKVLQQLNK